MEANILNYLPIYQISLIYIDLQITHKYTNYQKCFLWKNLREYEYPEYYNSDLGPLLSSLITDCHTKKDKTMEPNEAVPIYKERITIMTARLFIFPFIKWAGGNL